MSGGKCGSRFVREGLIHSVLCVVIKDMKTDCNQLKTASCGEVVDYF